MSRLGVGETELCSRDGRRIRNQKAGHGDGAT